MVLVYGKADRPRDVAEGLDCFRSLGLEIRYNTMLSAKVLISDGCSLCDVLERYFLIALETLVSHSNTM